MSALTIGDLVGYIRADGSDFERNLARSQLRMEGFRVDVNGRLRDIRGRFVRDTSIMGRALADSFSDAEREGTRITTVYSSVADAQSRTLRARLARVQAGARSLGSSFREAFGEARAAWQRLNFDRLGKVASGFLGVAASVGKVGAAIGAAVPLAAGLVAAVQGMAPAAAVAVSGLIAVRLAAGALKLGMIGVEDAVTAALDPEKAAEFEKALAKLSPNARAFAQEIKALAPELRKVQQSVQNKLFEGLDASLRSLGRTALPVVRTGLEKAALSLNRMAKGAAAAAVDLASSGALGRAIQGANDGLQNLEHVPGRVVTALGQIGAAAAPAFDRLTKAAGKAVDRFSEQFTRAFRSGALEKAIEKAIDLIGDLATVAGNVFKIIGSVFGAAEVSGGGFIGVLKEISGQLAKAFASPEIQGGLKAIFGVMSELGKAVGPILVSLLKTVGRIFEKLGPPVRELVRHLGDGLLRIADKLSPVLVELADVIGKIVLAALPLVDLVADLIVELLPALTPLFAALGDTVEAIAPFIAAFADAAGQLLMPILQALAEDVLPALLPAFTDMSKEVFPLLTQALIDLTPSLAELGVALADLLVAATPLIVKVISLGTALLTDLLPVIEPLIRGMAELTGGALTGLADFITRYVIPAVSALGALLSGDFSGAWEHVKTLVRNVADDFIANLTRMRDRGTAALVQLRDWVSQRANEMGQNLARSVSQKVGEAVRWFQTMPDRIRRAFGDLGSLLYNAGQNLIRGFINGVRSMVSPSSPPSAASPRRCRTGRGPQRGTQRSSPRLAGR